MRFGDIRRILDKATEDCKDCHDEDCHYDCSYYVAKLIKEEILNLLDQEQIQTDPISKIPCTLKFKGFCKVLPPNGENGDAWTIIENKMENGYGWVDQALFYWYDDKWNYIPNPPSNCKLQFM